MYVYISLNHFTLEKKLIPHCKSTILQKKIFLWCKNNHRSKRHWQSGGKTLVTPREHKELMF